MDAKKVLAIVGIVAVVAISVAAAKHHHHNKALEA